MKAAAMILAAAAGLSAQSRPGPTIAELEDEITGYIRKLTDWGGLVRYGSDNAELRPVAGRVVFIGDEITENWGEGRALFFPGKPYLNRGIAGQTTPQMLVRFRQDVIDLKPAVVVIQGGSNDLGGNTGPATTGTIADNIMTMTELAKLHGIAVVLASLTPVCDCIPDSPRRHLTLVRPFGKILGVNEWLEAYATKSGAVYVNYHSVLAQGRAIRKEFTVDGLQVNDAAYEQMAPLAEKAIAKALSRKP
jgi:lysophospholipase L1-like esterase